MWNYHKVAELLNNKKIYHVTNLIKNFLETITTVNVGYDRFLTTSNKTDELYLIRNDEDKCTINVNSPNMNEFNAVKEFRDRTTVQNLFNSKLNEIAKYQFDGS